MQAAISTDHFVMAVMEMLMNQADMWLEQERLNQVKSVLYMSLMDKTILTDLKEKQLPAEYIDDTPRVIEMWLRCLQLERRADSTLESYRGEMKNLFRYLGKHYADVTTNDIRSYLAWCQIVKKNKDTTINNKYHAFCSFFKWVMAEDVIEDGGCLTRKPKKDPMNKINKIKEEKKVRTILTEEQVEIIRCDCPTLRDRAIVEVLIATGMRIGELVRMDLCDVDMQSKKCIIYGKGRKERPAFFTPKALVHLKEYLSIREQVAECDSGLFLNFRRTGKTYTRVSDDSVRNMLKRIVKSDGRLEGVRLHPHMFRAYLATYMSRHGAGIDEIKRILGHSNINTTLECYIVEDVRETQAAHGRFAA